MNLHKYTLEELTEAISTSRSIRQVLIKLGVVPYGGNYDVFRKAVKYYDISIEHFDGQGWNTEDHSGILSKQSYKKTRKLEDILNKNTTYPTSKLRKRLVKAGLKQEQCQMCGITHWLNIPVSLELDHINGDRYDNRIENLRLLCPNCHSTTETYRGRNKSRYLSPDVGIGRQR
jgi:hypothetical protein